MNVDYTQIARTEHLPTRIAAQFTQQIQKGLLKAGDKLPTEHELSKNFGVSRTVIREAIAQLRNEGMIETRQGVGAFVIERSARHIRLDDSTDMDKEAFRHLFQLRLPLEIEAAGLAAQNRTPEHIRQLDDALARMAAAGKEAPDGMLADLDFHRTIAVATGNDYFVQFLGAISDRVMHTIVTSRKRIKLTELIEVVATEHTALRDAIAAGDAAQAREAMRVHMAGSAKRVALDFEFYP
ncbi:FadR/GntR family transcriptional regulator [Falsirhodobacter sp. alg1]|uniref:FadR/GntR family transcriptional regulator n=1 Tax=Falsirhodobacter sp. alg1 TaxID=1472418 RepID=UPI0005EE607F|nr:FadR/GntR family transcriptional regulator [Falsirhodobacter sp. alg1]